MKLTEYKAKRIFANTPEPEPAPDRLLKEDHLAFVVQMHAARSLHYDLRLELEGVLKSWALPRGPSLDPASKRLAVMVEDHPLEYRHFEGIIPEGNYGAGRVIIWDRGYYQHPAAKNRDENEQLLLEGLKKGDLKFVLAGEKIKGEFALVKTRWDKKSWLLLKKKDHYASHEDILQQNRSVLSRKTLEELSPTPDVEDSSLLPDATPDRINIEDILENSPVKSMPRGVKPMLATLVKEPFDHPDWIFEVKWDGYRALAEFRGGEVELYSRNGLSFNRTFSPLVQSLAKLESEALLDGEIVVLDDQGRPDFQMLQDFHKMEEGHLAYVVFDLLYMQGHELLNLPLLKRKELLKGFLPSHRMLKFSDHIEREGNLFYTAAREKNLEGIVAKQARSLYTPGKRSRQWLKIKIRQTQEAVIAGFTEPRGNRNYFGTLILGIFERDNLKYIGHSGGGFSEKDLQEIHGKLTPLITQECPFIREPPSNAPVTWVKPILVCEVTFSGWTSDGVLRQPVFLRLREDKNAGEVKRERPRSSK